MDELAITVRIKARSNPDGFLPACPKAERFCLIAQTTALEGQHLTTIKQLGYTIKITNDRRKHDR